MFRRIALTSQAEDPDAPIAFASIAMADFSSRSFQRALPLAPPDLVAMVTGQVTAARSLLCDDWLPLARFPPDAPLSPSAYVLLFPPSLVDFFSLWINAFVSYFVRWICVSPIGLFEMLYVYAFRLFRLRCFP